MAAPLLEPLLENLSATERRELATWLECPLHNRRRDVRELYAKLRKPTASTTKEDGSTAAVNERLTRSYLLARVEDYLLWKDGRSPAREQSNDLRLCQLYRRRGLQQHLTNRLNRLARKPYPFEDPAALHDRYTFSELLNERSRDRDRSYDPDYDRPDRQLLIAQAAARFRQAAISMAGARFSGRQPQLPLLDEYLTLVESHPEWLELPGLAVYYHVCRYQRPGPTAVMLPFPALVELLRTSLDRFPPNEQVTLLKLVLNFAIRRLNENTSRENLLAAFQLYDLGLREGLLLESGHLTNFTFNNFVGIALRLGDTAAAQRCLDDYAAALHPDSAVEVLALNQARLAYARGEFREAIFLLQAADYRDSVHLVNARTLLIRAYYELEEIEPMLDLIRATRILVRRRRLGYHRQIVLNNLKYLKKLAKLRPNDAKARLQLRREVEVAEKVSEREWILGKLLTLNSRAPAP